jgi:hypothetical protein
LVVVDERAAVEAIVKQLVAGWNALAAEVFGSPFT